MTTNYLIKDSQTKQTVATYSADKVKLARRKAEKMNQKYGSIRYVVTMEKI